MIAFDENNQTIGTFDDDVIQPVAKPITCLGLTDVKFSLILQDLIVFLNLIFKIFCRLQPHTRMQLTRISLI